MHEMRNDKLLAAAVKFQTSQSEKRFSSVVRFQRGFKRSFGL
jgi:hypothetical protein